MKRAAESTLQEMLEFFPCVVILGPRQCGKTTLLGTLPNIWRRFDLEIAADHAQISRDPDLFLRLHERQLSIDEAQLYPPLFNALRVAIDRKRSETGRFVVTGSSSPSLIRAISESLAGRVGIIELAPFSFAETRQVFASPLLDLLAGEADEERWFEDLESKGTLQEIHTYWWRGGYPEPWLRGSSRFRTLWMENYVRTYLERDVARLFPGLDLMRFRRFLSLLSNLSGTVINYSDAARSLAVSQPTARDYFTIAEGTFLWRNLPSFDRDPLKRVVKHPRGHLRDSGLLHHLLRLPDLDGLLSHPKLGSSWEATVIEELLRGLECRGIPFDAYYYRTSGGAEVDLILEGTFGLIAVEVTYAQTVKRHQHRSLREFVERFNCRFGLVINNDEIPRRYEKNLYGIPFAFL